METGADAITLLDIYIRRNVNLCATKNKLSITFCKISEPNFG